MSRSITSYHANAVVSLKRRWTLRGITGDKMSDRFVVGVTPQALCQSISMIQDDIAAPTVYFGLFSAVRVMNVKVYYAAPVLLATDTAVSFPSTQGFTVSIEPYATTAANIQIEEFSATSRNADDLVCVSWSPDPAKYPVAASYQAASSTFALCNIAAYLGAIVDITFSAVIADGAFTFPGTSTTPATNGSIGYGCLDAAVAPGSRAWLPVGTQTPLI